MREIKERFCYCAQDYQDELHKSKTSQQAEKRFELPDGQVISLGNECFRAPEMLFQPSLFGRCFNFSSFLLNQNDTVKSEIFARIIFS